MSSAPCPPKAPDYYLTTTHCIAAISAPINLYAMYLVLFKSPAMSNYKYCICYLQLSSFFTELQMTLVCPGYYFFPLLGDINTGEFFAHFLTSHIYMTIYTFFLSSELPAIVWCFVYRHSSAVDMKTSSKSRRPLKKLSLFGAQLFPFGVAFCMYMSEISREEIYMYLQKSYPQCIYWMEDKRFMVYDYNTNVWVAITGIGALLCICLFTILFCSLGVHTMLLLQELRPLMSVQTYKMHRTALISLSAQVVIPSVLLILPLYVCFYVVFMELVEYQSLATNTTVMISCHSGCSSIVMIITNPRYRQFIKNGISGCFSLKNENQPRRVTSLTGATSRLAIEPLPTNRRNQF